MTFWRRRRGPRGSDPDPGFPHLNRRDADQLRQEVRDALRDHGAAVRFDGDQAVIRHPRRGTMTVSLAGLSRDVAYSQHPKAARHLSSAYVNYVFADPDVAELTDAELYAGLRLRLVPAEGAGGGVQQVTDAAALGPFTHDTVATLVVDAPHAVQTVPLERLRALDDLESLERAATANTRDELSRAPVDVRLHSGAEQHPGARFWSVEADDAPVSSAALLLSDALAWWLPKLDVSEGLLVAVPTRHSLLVRPITSGEDLIEGMTSIAASALEKALDSRHPLSPLLHVFHEGEIETISAWEEQERHLRIIPTERLIWLMRETP